jgi:1-acyl-sn-glycerol-3-phosphate acyltransferase
MCNHQSALDIFSLLNSLPVQFKWIAKRELFYIPFLGWAMKRAGYISLDRKHPREAIKAMDDAAKKIREGTNIIIFPEGTRSKDGHLLPFKKGGFSLALRAKVPIVPVGISGSNRLQPKGSFIPNQKGVIYLRIGKPVETAQGSRSAKTEIMMTVRQAIEGLMTEKEA